MNRQEHAIAALKELDNYKASARKSFGEYKAIIIRPNGSTEILGKNVIVETVRQETVFYSGPSEIYHFKRGKVFQNRDDAIAYAERHIEGLRNSFRKHLA